jgi:hypothetical protein
VSRDPERFLVLVCRELGAAEARIVFTADEGAAAGPGSAGGEIRCPMAGGREVVARFERAPEDPDARKRRLEMLVAAFDAVAIEDAPPSLRSRPSPALSLREELEGLRGRAGAVNAIVIDANSPVVWGAARSEGLVEVPPLPSSPSLAEAARGAEGAPGPDVAATSRRALRIVRALPEMAALRKGKPLRYVERRGETPLVAHAFASIYLLVVVFDTGVGFDELRAERSIVESLPRVERLVLALPPHEPEPTQGAGVIAMRRPRRR